MARYPQLDETPPPARGRWWWRFLGRHLPGVSVSLMVALLITILLWPYIVVTVPSGHVGVLWKRFNGFDVYCWCFVGRGTILDPREIREEGLHLVWPWDRLFLYDLRLQSTSQVYNAISKDGVNVRAQISVRYQLLHNSVGVLHKFIGPEFMQSVVSPEIGSQAREVISEYTAQEVYTSRDPIQKKIRDNAQKSLGANLNKLVQPEAMEQPDPKHYNEFLQDSIQLLDTLVLSIELPPEIVAAINRQTEQYYMIQEFRFRVAREAEESKRKQIEADGIAAFQRTVSKGISDSYLRWRGIEATIQLAQSPNSKIVVIGSGKDGLPIILGNIDSPAVPAVPAAKPPAGANPTSPSSDAAPAPAEKAPPNTPPKPPGGASNGSGPAGALPANGMTAGGASPTVVEPDTAPASHLNLPDLETIFSKISGAVRGAGSDTNPESGAKPK